MPALRVWGSVAPAGVSNSSSRGGSFGIPPRTLQDHGVRIAYRETWTPQVVCHRRNACGHFVSLGAAGVPRSLDGYIPRRGEIPERSKGLGCKPSGYAFEGSNPSLATEVRTPP